LLSIIGKSNPKIKQNKKYFGCWVGIDFSSVLGKPIKGSRFGAQATEDSRSGLCPRTETAGWVRLILFYDLHGREFERSIVVEHNRKILYKDMFKHTILEDGNELELIRFVGGG